MLGLAARERKDFAAAEHVFQALAQESPGDAWVRNQLALVLVEQPDDATRRRALELAELSVRQDPNAVERADDAGDRLPPDQAPSRPPVSRGPPAAWLWIWGGKRSPVSQARSTASGVLPDAQLGQLDGRRRVASSGCSTRTRANWLRTQASPGDSWAMAWKTCSAAASLCRSGPSCPAPPDLTLFGSILAGGVDARRASSRGPVPGARTRLPADPGPTRVDLDGVFHRLGGLLRRVCAKSDPMVIAAGSSFGRLRRP